MAARPGSISLLEALEMARRKAEASQQQATPFDFGETVRGADRAIQQGVFGAVDAVGGEVNRLKDNWIGLKDIGQGAGKQTSLADALASMGTQRGGFTRPDLATQREGLGQMASGALDVSPIIGGVWSIHDWHTAFEKMHKGEIVKSVLKPY